MARKGFPESYDTRRLLSFMRDVKSGATEARAPVYSHVVYDVIADEETIVRQPDILILEGLNVLQVSSSATEFVSDYFDFSIYVDADESDILAWFIARFMALRESVFKDPNSFFRHFAAVERRGGAGDGDGDLARHQRPQPAREHPADPRAGVADPPQGRRPPRHQRPTPQVVGTFDLTSFGRAR